VLVQCRRCSGIAPPPADRPNRPLAVQHRLKTHQPDAASQSEPIPTAASDSGNRSPDTGCVVRAGEQLVPRRPQHYLRRWLRRLRRIRSGHGLVASEAFTKERHFGFHIAELPQRYSEELFERDDSLIGCVAGDQRIGVCAQREAKGFVDGVREPPEGVGEAIDLIRQADWRCRAKRSCTVAWRRPHRLAVEQALCFDSPPTARLRHSTRGFSSSRSEAGCTAQAHRRQRATTRCIRWGTPTPSRFGNAFSRLAMSAAPSMGAFRHGRRWPAQ